MMDQPMDLCEKMNDQTVDLCEKGNGSGSGSGSDENSTNIKKTCADCKTTKTPLWRGGPEGPKSLCNACGIRHRKKRRALLGLSEENNKRKERRSGGGVSLKLKLVGVKREVVFNTSDLEKHMKMGEEEQQAAFLLMALSCGSVYG